jgi:hypothetical protein
MPDRPLPDALRVAIRGFLGPVRQFEERIEVDESNLDVLVAGLAIKHSSAIAAGMLDMIELEFLDDPDPDARFFRIGTNPAGMVMPFPINLGKPS